jgi:hypothetical protein
MIFLMMIALQAAQPPEPVSTRDLRVAPGQAPEGTSPVPISEVAEPLGLAMAGFDADHDARTSRAELIAAVARTFAAADTNGDGALGYIEFSGWAQTWLGSQNALPGPFAVDADGDNRITREEFSGELGRQFDRLDANRDGSVTHAELLTVRNPRLGPMWDRDGRPIRQRQRQRRQPG